MHKVGQVILHFESDNCFELNEEQGVEHKIYLDGVLELKSPDGSLALYDVSVGGWSWFIKCWPAPGGTS